MNAKQVLKATGAAVGAVGAVTLANRALERRAGSLPRPLPGSGETYRWRGMDTYYTDLGNPANQTLVLVHGIGAAASSNEFVEIAEPLAETYHVVAPDLPGFGRSDRPPLQYTNEHYEDYLRDFLADVLEDDPIVLASSLSSAYVVSAAAETDVESLIFVCPTTTTMPGGERPRVRTLFRAPLIGEIAFNALSTEGSLEYFSADHAYYDPMAYSEERKTYDWQTTHQAGARFAPASFLAGDLDSDLDLGPAIRELDVPTTFVWGREAETTPVAEGRALAEAANASLVVVDYAALLPHDEHPDAFLDALATHLAFDRDVTADEVAVERDT